MYSSASSNLLPVLRASRATRARPRRAYTVKSCKVEKDHSKSTELVLDPVTSFWKAPLDIQVGTTDSAGTAFKASFVGHMNAVLFQPVDIGRTNIQAGGLPAFSETNRRIDDSDMGFIINPESIQIQLVFYPDVHHLRLLHASHISRSNLKRDIFPLNRFRMILCFVLFETPLTVSISLAAKPIKAGKVVKISVCR